MRRILATLAVVGALLFSAGSAWAVTGEYICTNVAAEDQKFGYTFRSDLALNSMGETKFILNTNKVKLIYPFDTPFELIDTYSGNWSAVDIGGISVIAQIFEVIASDEEGPLPDTAAVVWIKDLDQNIVAIITHRPVIGTQNQVRVYTHVCRK